MKRTRIHVLGLVAAIAAATLSGAHAQTPTPLSSGSILLGFRASGGNGSGTSYLVNLGQFTTFTSTANAITDLNTTLSLGNIGADLVSLYGSSWYTRNDLYWGIVGYRDSPSSANPTVYSTLARTNVNTQTSGYSAMQSNARVSTRGNILAVETASNGFNNLTTGTSNSFVGGVYHAATQTDAANTGSWNYQNTLSGTKFGSLSGWTTIEGNFANGANGTALDLWAYSNTPATSTDTVTYRGVFGINSSGVLNFNVVPEPSPLALGAVGFAASAVFIALRRRRTAQSS